jgi:hypothetical protein
MHRIFTLISILILDLGIAVFLQAQPQKPPAPTAPAEEPPPVLTVPKDYHYNARGRRDPFVNPVPKPKGPAAVAPPVARPAGLKGVLVAEAQIAGVVTSREPSMNVVIISAPGTRTPYFARVGDELYDATVKSIKLDTITFALTAPGGVEQKTPREIVRKVRPTPGEDK